MPNDGPFNTLAPQFLDSFSSNVSATQSRGLSLDPVITNNYLLLNINFKHPVVLPASTIFPNHSKCHHSNNSPSQTCQTTPKKNPLIFKVPHPSHVITSLIWEYISWWVIIISFLYAILTFFYLFFSLQHNHPAKFPSEHLNVSREKEVCWINSWLQESAWLYKTVLLFSYLSSDHFILFSLSSKYHYLFPTYHCNCWSCFPCNQHSRSNQKSFLDQLPTSVTEQLSYLSVFMGELFVCLLSFPSCTTPHSLLPTPWCVSSNSPMSLWRH